MIIIFVYLSVSIVVLLYYSRYLNKKKCTYPKSIVILSGDYDWDTLMRVEKGIELKKNLFRRSKLIICGRNKSVLMSKLMRQYKCRNFVTQNKSTNTLEDAIYLKGIIKTKDIFPLMVVTSQPHLRRALHTFRAVFPNREIVGFPTDDLLNLYSPFLPTGWIAVLMNVMKDWKYNGKI